MSRELIVYFSRRGRNLVNGCIRNLKVGNTEIVANILQKITGSDLFQIEQVNPYSKNYYVCIDEAKQDLRRGVRPELISCLDHLDNYDILYLGYPIYWGTAPAAVFSFLERYNFAGKTIFPFCTHENSGMGQSENDLRQICPSAIIKKGLPIKGSEVRLAYDSIEQWLQCHRNKV